MSIMFDFTCDECGHTHERLVDKDCRTDPCPKCGGIANRIISPVRVKLPFDDPGFPGAYDKWARDRERATRKAEKQNRED